MLRITNQYKMLNKSVLLLLMKHFFFASQVVRFKNMFYGWNREGKTDGPKLDVFSEEKDDRKL